MSETMLVAGLNDSPDALVATAEFLAGVKPRIAYLAVPIRPPPQHGHPSGPRFQQAEDDLQQSAFAAATATRSPPMRSMKYFCGEMLATTASGASPTSPDVG